MGAESADIKTTVGFMLLHDRRTRLVARIEGVGSCAREQYLDNDGLQGVADSSWEQRVEQDRS
jgi:hypothetical protein